MRTVVRRMTAARGRPWPTLPRPAEERFWEKVKRWDPDECWDWTAGHSPEGYGRFNATWRVPGYAHRFAYELLIGPIPDGYQIDHLCRNRGCVNPKHMEPVTQRMNLLRGTSPSAHNARVTACIHGHPFDEANTYYPKRGGRFCRACARRRQRERKARLAT